MKKILTGFPVLYKNNLTIISKDGSDINAELLQSYFEKELGKHIKFGHVKKQKDRISFSGSIRRSAMATLYPDIADGYMLFERDGDKVIILYELFFYNWMIIFGLISVVCFLVPIILHKILSLLAVWLFYFLFHYLFIAHSFNIIIYELLEKFRNGREIYLEE